MPRVKVTQFGPYICRWFSTIPKVGTLKSKVLSWVFTKWRQFKSKLTIVYVYGPTKGESPCTLAPSIVALMKKLGNGLYRLEKVSVNTQFRLSKCICFVKIIIIIIINK